MRDKVIKTARELALDVDVKTLEEPTRTVEQAATAVGCEAGEIAKSLVFIADGEPIVCVTSGAHRVDTDRLAELLDAAEVRPASRDEVRAATGFPVGGVPPFAHGLPVVFDVALLAHNRIWAAAGDGNSLFCVDPRKLAERTKARVAAVDHAEPRAG
jgi:prolyl-tRNA editing enzyme YbaK/EbsC (Cys-tRNA(Pro) deacylase)